MLDGIKGIGPKMLGILKKMGIESLDDLVNYYPYRYNHLALTSLKDGAVTVSGIVESPPIVLYIKKNLNKLTFRLQVDNYLVNVVLFNRAFMKQSLQRGKTITVIGEYDERHNTITGQDVRLKAITQDVIEPVYHLTSGITSRTLHGFIMSALEKVKISSDFIPDELQEEYNFQDKISSLHMVHNPNSLEKIKGAIVRLKYEELFKFMFKINYLKSERVSDLGLERKVQASEVEKFMSHLPFELTIDQKKACDEIIFDLQSQSRMNRLILGDVGSGKTVVAVVGIYYNYLSGYQSVLLVPTEILAVQHFINIENMLKDYHIRVELLRGKTTTLERIRIISDLKEGNIDVLIGTHAILENDVEFKNLGLVITDEQHRFGVNQRSSLQNKGNMCDVLYMSATPIPRTYALTIYGDMDISMIKTKPQGRKEIITTLVGTKDIKTVLQSMLDEIKKGHQVYIVCPMIESDEDTTLTDVKSLKRKIDIAYNEKIPTAILHGKQTSKEKEMVMSNFKSGLTKILISTTVIEVGVDVPNATMMVIFNAERFGLATIHQLRGRIGRNGIQSYCILISDKKSERLEVLVKSSDGFYISEQDFKMRGEGDLFGVRQSGDMVFKIADLRSDMRILTQTNVDSMKFIEENRRDDFANYPQFKMLKDELKHLD